MAEEEEEGTEEGAENKEEEGKKKGGGGIVGMILPAILAGAASFGGSFFGGAQPAPAEASESVQDNKLPGPTYALNPFVLNVQDKDGAAHPAKLTFAIELKHGVAPESFEVFVPRVRDTYLTYLRTMTFEEMRDGKSKVKLTEDLLAATHKLGAEDASQVLVQDFVIQ